MQQREYFDLVAMLSGHWRLVSDAYWGGLPTVHPAEDASGINALLDVAVLNGDLKLDSGFRKVLDEIACGRDVANLTVNDIRRIVDRHGEWPRDNR
jgi:hypothetical protein